MTGAGPAEVVGPPLGHALLKAAEGHARFALRSYLDEDDIVPLQAAVAAGAAVELLIKAVLYREAPALLAMKGDVHSILMFSGKPGVPGKGYLDCRTIVGDDTRRALIAIRPSLNSISTEIDAALTRRNAAVHLALATKHDLVVGVRAMCVTVAALLPELDRNPDQFWGDGLVAHAQVLAAARGDERRLLLEQLKTAALERLARIRAVDSAVIELLVAERAAPEDGTEDDGDHFREAHQCPVCEYWGWLSGPVTRGEMRMVESHYYDGWEVERTWYPESFDCGICRLHLDVETLGVAGFSSVGDLQPTEATEEELQDMYSELQAEYEYERWHDERR